MRFGKSPFCFKMGEKNGVESVARKSPETFSPYDKVFWRVTCTCRVSRRLGREKTGTEQVAQMQID
jgi:hypothetical protein